MLACALQAPPGPPQILAATAEGLITFDVPATDGGSQIVSYKVTLKDGGTTIGTFDITCPPAGCTDADLQLQATGSLTSGNSYTVEAMATNAVGDSTAATTSFTYSPPVSWRAGASNCGQVVQQLSPSDCLALLCTLRQHS